jgi:hypothetical protein
MATRCHPTSNQEKNRGLNHKRPEAFRPQKVAPRNRARLPYKRSRFRAIPPAKSVLASVLMAAFAQFALFRGGARLGGLALNSHCPKGKPRALLQTSIPYGLAVAKFLALKIISIKLRRNSVCTHGV